MRNVFYISNKKWLQKAILARLQDTRLISKSQLSSNIPAMNKWNLKLKTQYHLHQHLIKMKHLSVI